ncbi:MAG: hypothetical protein ACYDAY_10465 [Candidatus Dormibacteria bacterium]
MPGMGYADALLRWHDFYLTAGAAAATLAGLLFVGLSLHIRVVASEPDVRSLARVTLTDFFAVLMVALLMLVPPTDPIQSGSWLIAVSVISAALIVRPAWEAVRSRRARTIGLRVLIARFGVSGLCCLATGAIGILMAGGDYQNALSALLGPVVLFLVVAVRNTWDLLVTVARASMARQREAG